MRKFLSFLTLIFVTSSISIFSQDIKITGSKGKIHNHETYILSYNEEKLNPDWVIWRLTSAEAARCDTATGNRESKFQFCTKTAQHNDYTKTGYDRGHMCPNNDRDWDKKAAKNTFRMCNICPQSPTLNRGIWQQYEKAAHTYAYDCEWIDICCGPIYTAEKGKEKYLSAKSKVVVPEKFFKIFYNSKYEFLECFIFTQKGEVEKSSIEEIEKLTGFKIKLLKNR